MARQRDAGPGAARAGGAAGALEGAPEGRSGTAGACRRPQVRGSSPQDAVLTVSLVLPLLPSRRRRPAPPTPLALACPPTYDSPTPSTYLLMLDLAALSRFHLRPQGPQGALRCPFVGPPQDHVGAPLEGASRGARRESNALARGRGGGGRGRSDEAPRGWWGTSGRADPLLSTRARRFARFPSARMTRSRCVPPRPARPRRERAR